MSRHLLVSGLLSFAIATVAYAGGWAVITVRDLPDFGVMGTPLRLTFSVRQHGLTPLDSLSPTVRAAASTGQEINAFATRTANKGEYTASLVFPQPGEWIITIRSSFLSTATTLPMLEVISPESPLPMPPLQTTRGARLFTAKGCIACHRHEEIPPERTSPAWIDLTGKRFAPEYLEKFLADPSVKAQTTPNFVKMPDLQLTKEEIAALVAFVNSAPVKRLATTVRNR